MTSTGAIIALDPGAARIGVARSDGTRILALPVCTVRRGRDGSEWQKVTDIVTEYEATTVLVGLPRLLSGKEGTSAQNARRFARRLARTLPQVEVRLIDERLSSVQAHQQLSESGMNSWQAQKAVVDQAAAVIILEAALESARRTGQLPGELVGQARRDGGAQG